MKISIEGGISSGKSTLLLRLQEETRLPVFLEPIASWTMLENFYKEPSRWGFTFNLEVLLSMSKWRENSYDSLYERSPNSCRHIFTQLQFENGDMTAEELLLFDKVFRNFTWDQDVIIYIRTDPEVCYNRMHIRNRECEEKVSLKYLQDLHEKHEHMMEYITQVKPEIRIFVVNGNKDADSVYESVHHILVNLEVV